MSRGLLVVGSDKSRMGDSEPSQKVFSICPFYRLSSANPLAAYEHMCALYVRAITVRRFLAVAAVATGLKRSNQAMSKRG